MPKIWIELEKPTKETGQLNVDVANELLARVAGEELSQKFIYFPYRNQYGFGGDYGYIDLPDRGTWFSFDFSEARK